MTDTFDFNQNLILEDEKVMLRPLQQSDFDNFIGFSINEPTLWKFSLVQPNSHENLQHYLDIAVEARNRKTEFPFIVFDKTQNKPAGSTRFYDINFDFKTLQLGYTWYGSAFQGTGLNKRCKYLLLEFAFEKLGMERVEFRADSNNERSIAAMKSIGCKVDGILRSNMPTYQSDQRRDSIVLSILRSEWLGGVKEKLRDKF